MTARFFTSRRFVSVFLSLLACFTLPTIAQAQTEVAGAFEGRVTDIRTKNPIVGATVRIRNVRKGLLRTLTTDTDGRFYQGLLEPDAYEITIQKLPEYTPATVRQTIFTNQTNQSVPLPVELTPALTATTTPPTPEPNATPQPGASPTPVPTPQAVAQQTTEEGEGLAAPLSRVDGRRGGVFTEREVSLLPLGGGTVTRTFDELAFLLPGVALPPQTQGTVAGPGVGAGVGSAGQFSVNGLRSRSNNFTVDGSDNNDEDIGVRRQGFFSLIPQPIESIKEYQVTTLLAPAQFGRNIGAQVNAVSKSGGNETHGTVFGFFNSSQLNARNPFDTTNGNATTPLRSGNQNVIVGRNFVFVPSGGVDARNFLNGQFVPTDGVQRNVTNESGGKDSFTLGQGGLVLGGPLKTDRMFYFLSLEGQNLNATQEESFAVPTVAQRGIFGTGATGIAVDRFSGGTARSYPTTLGGNAIFSLFPFPNNPGGIYGPNTFTRVLPSSAQGKVASGKFDGNFKINERQQSVTARYNFTDDYRNIPVTGGALFSTLRPRVRTQNFSAFLNSEVSAPASTRPMFNQVRLSYGRTRLNFEEERDQIFQVPSERFPSTPFLLNAPLLTNFVLPPTTGAPPNGAPNTGPVFYQSLPGVTVEDAIGPVGQVIVAGFSPIGVDVFNFPQRRVNNTYQLADTLTMRVGRHNFAFGTDIRRTELNSDLPRNSRPLITFNGAPTVGFDPVTNDFGFTNRFISPLDLAASSAPSGVFQSLAVNPSASAINLRYYQLDFFGQDEWRIRPNLSLSYGLRYEDNTTPREVNNSIESTFGSQLLDAVPGLRTFIAGRTKIFDPDRNNLAPRFGFAYSPTWFGRDHSTVIRGGYGIYFDQILGAVVSQSRNVFPNFLTVNLAGGLGSSFFPSSPFEITNPINPVLGLVLPNTLNTLDLRGFTFRQQVEFIRFITNSGFGPDSSVLGFTLPSRELDTPTAQHYSITFEQQLSSKLTLSASYVGTQGRHLLRATTPNLGPNAVLLPVFFDASNFEPQIFGIAVSPGSRLTAGGDVAGGRPVPTAGAVNSYETTANSRYDALQLQLRGRFKSFLASTQFQVNYTFSKATDDVSDVFDLAGAPALPQNSLTNSGERGPSNFDVRHRVSYEAISTLPGMSRRNSVLRFLFGGLQIASTSSFQTGQPFTVNSIFDVNLDGNLTDRLDSLTGITITGNRQQPLVASQQVRDNPSLVLARVGQDGRIGRNSFRAGNVFISNVAVIRNIRFTETQSLVFRMEVFNLFNRANFGVPVRFLEAPGFGQATETITPARRIQFALKYSF
jgi:hypothetical protein